jgi:hypothetical protein
MTKLSNNTIQISYGAVLWYLKADGSICFITDRYLPFRKVNEDEECLPENLSSVKELFQDAIEEDFPYYKSKVLGAVELNAVKPNAVNLKPNSIKDFFLDFVYYTQRKIYVLGMIRVDESYENDNVVPLKLEDGKIPRFVSNPELHPMTASCINNYIDRIVHPFKLKLCKDLKCSNDNCIYLHSKDELRNRIETCPNDCSCERRNCLYIHTPDTLETFSQRVGQDIPCLPCVKESGKTLQIISGSVITGKSDGTEPVIVLRVIDEIYEKVSEMVRRSNLCVKIERAHNSIINKNTIYLYVSKVGLTSGKLFTVRVPKSNLTHLSSLKKYKKIFKLRSI